ncbi:MAG TPA: ABC transporter permease [Chitinophagales bacterium]|nr:ABC transporter permease [Chitinophagales bacterium]
MRRLLRIEFIKVRSYGAFWIVLAIYALIFIMVTSTLRMIESSLSVSAVTFFSFPDVWHHLAYIASFMNILPAILIIMLITNEYTFKTFRQNLIDGLSREEIVYSKFILIGAVSVFLIGLIFLWGLVRGLIAGHFDDFGDVYKKIYFLLRLFVQMSGYMSVAALFAFILKRSAISILLYLVYVVAFERILRLRLPDEIDRFFPMKNFGGLIPDPGTIALQVPSDGSTLSPDAAIALAFAYILVCLGGCYLLVNRSDL